MLSLSELADMIHFICNEAANTACLAYNCLREHFVSREFLTALLCGNSVVFIEHCDFLQLFPTINFYVAAQILSSMTLKNISEHLSKNLNGGVKDALVFVPPIEEAMLDSFIGLFTGTDDDDDDVYLRLQHGKGFHNLVHMSYVKHIDPASKA
jgi:hypothetical protein